MYILAIIAVNAIFIYLRYLEPDAKKTVTIMHVFFGTLQLVYLLPKIVSDRSKAKDK